MLSYLFSDEIFDEIIFIPLLYKAFLYAFHETFIYIRYGLSNGVLLLLTSVGDYYSLFLTCICYKLVFVDSNSYFFAKVSVLIIDCETF